MDAVLRFRTFGDGTAAMLRAYSGDETKPAVTALVQAALAVLEQQVYNPCTHHELQKAWG